MPLTIELITPKHKMLSEAADSVTIPTKMGEITVLPNHIPLVAILEPGELTLRSNGTESYLAVSGGYLEVRPGSVVRILADTAERAEELDVAKIEEARKLARKIMDEKIHTDDVAYAAAAAVLERELARLKVARRRRRPS